MSTPIGPDLTGLLFLSRKAVDAEDKCTCDVGGYECHANDCEAHVAIMALRAYVELCEKGMLELTAHFDKLTTPST